MSGLTEPLLALLAEHPDGLSLPRVCKRLGVRMSVLLRELAWIGEDAIGDTPGPGWVRVDASGETQVATITARGHARLGRASAPNA